MSIVLMLILFYYLLAIHQSLFFKKTSSIPFFLDTKEQKSRGGQITTTSLTDYLRKYYKTAK